MNRKPSWEWLKRRMLEMVREDILEDRHIDRTDEYYFLCEWIGEYYPAVSVERFYDDYSGAWEYDIKQEAKNLIHTVIDETGKWFSANAGLILPPRDRRKVSHAYYPPACLCPMLTNWRWRTFEWLAAERRFKEEFSNSAKKVLTTPRRHVIT